MAPARAHDGGMSESTHSSEEPGSTDEVSAAGDAGVGLGAGEPSTFEPEEDPEAVLDDVGD